ncbi:arginine N-methyltransferase-like protein [Phyllosticta paracitricarpa]|uniref:Protein arginine N-methyltransferase n=2 Tax=Phyllosticta TaxID=121621 RepID=A0ABR1M3N4_9PEZI
MDTESLTSMDDMPIFFVGHHESKRSHPVTEQLLHHAQDLNYDMLTAPITNAHFQARVLTALSTYFTELQASPTKELALPLITPLSPADTLHAPNDSISQLLALTSPWIDLASPDPVIAHISRQVFTLEIAYAAFCGFGNVIVQGPKLHHGDLHGHGVAQYARAIQEALAIGQYINIQIMFPMTDNPNDESHDDVGNLSRFVRDEYLATSEQRGKSEEVDNFGTWDAWNVIRTVCKYNQRVSVALTLPRNLPHATIQRRWFSEPLRLISIPGTTFVKNKKGYWVLPIAHQMLLFRYMRLRTVPWILLTDAGPIPGVDDPEMIMTSGTGFLPQDAVTVHTQEPTPVEAAKSPPQKKPSDPTPHLSYMRHLQRNQPPKTQIERFGSGYQDYLQAPLQPLTDNLESITYEVFEKDPVKYEWYERAIEAALKDWASLKKPASSPDGAVVVAVVGAGRGPLVTRALQASKNSGVRIQAWAVEKNPNAYVLLQRHNRDSWNGAVTVVKSDMRYWRGPHREDGTYGHVDIMVSELLGSFADNELSPECLDGVQHVLNPTHGISIPQSYTAHLTPASAPKLHADVTTRSFTDPTAPETPHVVMLHAIDYLSTILPTNSNNHNHAASPTGGSYATAVRTGTTSMPSDSSMLVPHVQQAWEFVHPVHSSILTQSSLRRGGSAAGGVGGATGGDGANEHNARSSRTAFKCKNRGVCHGIAGYFESVLYAKEGKDANGEKVELSTNPITMDAKSRDMISWFPIWFPLKNPMYVPDDSEIVISMWRQTDDRKVWYEWMIESFVEVGGRKLRVAVSEVHSSRKAGCLM